MDISSLRERSAPKTFSVSELNLYIKRLFDNDLTLSAVSVKGEISNFTNHKSGHLYFSLKDSDGQIKCVMFRSSAVRLKFPLENGMRVILFGSVSTYVQGGAYQVYVNSIEPDGIGALYLAYERLKEKLYLEGLFDESHKKTIPSFPTRIGVITSPSGAAVRDIINVTGRRFPLANIYIYPSLVQGDAAEKNLIEALDYFDRSRLVDLIIIGRGGGSIEDLWAFNGEMLARKIYESKTPIISAVGHETDFTICDFVSDLRAPTPSAAAELAVPDVRELLVYIDRLSDRAIRALENRALQNRERLSAITKNSIFTSPKALFEKRKSELSLLQKEIQNLTDRKINLSHNAFKINAEKLNALSPLSVLSRGYSVAEHNGQILKDAKSVKLGDEISLKLSHGTLKATVTGREKGKEK
jgi:exodeoxyribonuclease VII large subunit